jgi:hypothetical protein
MDKLFFNFEFEFRKYEPKNIFLSLENLRYIEYLYLRYFDRVKSNMPPALWKQLSLINQSRY